MAEPRQLDPLPKHFTGIKFKDAYDRAQFRAWLGKLQQRRAHLRVIQPYKDIDISKSLPKRILAITFPWTIEQYPGKVRLLSEVVGVSPKCAAKWLRVGYLSPQAANRAATWLEAKAAEMLALAGELRAEVQKKKAPG